MNDKRGLSVIVVTLILVLLSIVAVGVVWVVINNIIQSSSGQINTGTACLDLGSVTATSITDTSGTTPPDGTKYDVTIKRSAGTGDIGGVKITLFNNTANSDLIDISGNINPLETKTEPATSSPGIPNVTKIEVTPYLTDGKPCSTSTKTF